MAKTKSLGILFTLILGLIGFHFADKAVVAQQKTEKAPAFALKLLDGGELKSTELQGKVAVLKFKASW